MARWLRDTQRLHHSLGQDQCRHQEHDIADSEAEAFVASTQVNAVIQCTVFTLYGRGDVAADVVTEVQTAAANVVLETRDNTVDGLCVATEIYRSATPSALTGAKATYGELKTLEAVCSRTIAVSLTWFPVRLLWCWVCAIGGFNRVKKSTWGSFTFATATSGAESRCFALDLTTEVSRFVVVVEVSVGAGRCFICANLEVRGTLGHALRCFRQYSCPVNPTHVAPEQTLSSTHESNELAFFEWIFSTLETFLAGRVSTARLKLPAAGADSQHMH